MALPVMLESKDFLLILSGLFCFGRWASKINFMLFRKDLRLVDGEFMTFEPKKQRSVRLAEADRVSQKKRYQYTPLV